jgi:hypothetical protein
MPSGATTKKPHGKIMTTATDLAEAKAARHKLLMGKSEVEVRTEAGTVKYNVADLPRLDAYIAKLEREVAGKKPRALNVVFTG